MVSPPAPSELELVHRALRHLRPGLDPALARRLRTADWAAASVEEGGQFHRVLVLEDVGVLRMTRAHEVGAAPGDLIAILEALKQAGALSAELEVI